MSPNEMDRLLAALERPSVPEGLRARALATARTARAAGAERQRLEDRLWGSRALRLAWAGAVVALAVANLVPGALPAAPGPERVQVAAAAGSRFTDLDALLQGLGPRRATLGEALGCLEELLCAGFEDCARTVVKGDTR